MTQLRWFAAHVLMVLRAKDGAQHAFPVMENIVLIQASDSDAAFSVATEHGRSEETDSQGTQRLADGRPAAWRFLGIRKVITCDFDGEPTSRGEVSYSQFSVHTEHALQLLAEGGAVDITYED